MCEHTLTVLDSWSPQKSLMYSNFRELIIALCKALQKQMSQISIVPYCLKSILGSSRVPFGYTPWAQTSVTVKPDVSQFHSIKLIVRRLKVPFVMPGIIISLKDTLGLCHTAFLETQSFLWIFFSRFCFPFAKLKVCGWFYS